jgi:hypothetical protein
MWFAFFCHPERSRGICFCLSGCPTLRVLCEGWAFSSISNFKSEICLWDSSAIFRAECCHPERSRGICGAFEVGARSASILRTRISSLGLSFHILALLTPTPRAARPVCVMVELDSLMNAGRGRQSASLAPATGHLQPVLIVTPLRLEIAASPTKQSLAAKSNRDNSTSFS